MTKAKKFAVPGIRQISGGKDPLRLVKDFIIRMGFDPDRCQREVTLDNARWMVPTGEDEELEVLLEGLRTKTETTIYMGVNIVTVPIRGAYDLLAAALEIADGLIGIKVSLVGHYLVLSASLGAADISVDDIEYHYKLIVAQRSWFRDALADELGWDELNIS
ncbi:MAG: hypothetical protein GYA55_14980 [SAR324 cluster bacterium]|uniref:YbjN domain-containing protein n=1 Tax=SAR324 cluster bacterium TaxID=2024889 RepID=A0A7X9ILP3_9DELT|nr:hypothetical protein [SAR324 cluster bacterium]